MTAAPDEHTPLLYTVPEALAMLRMGRTTFYAEVNARRLQIIKRGRSTLVTADDIAAYVNLLRSEAEDL